MCVCIQCKLNFPIYADLLDGFTLSAGKSHSDYVEIMWDNVSTELPKGNVVMNIDFAYVYTQKQFI